MKAKPLGYKGTIVDTAAGYDRWAEIYESDHNPLTLLEEPEAARLLGEIAGRDVLDVGCGTGRHALRLRAAGANVTALDFSEGMLDKARAKPGADGIAFARHDLAAPLPFADASFDRVQCSLVLEHIVDLDLLFGEMRRVCRPDGWLVVTAMHPAMMLCGVQAGFTDPASGEKIHPKSHDNQLSDIVMAVVRAGLRIDAMTEHAVDDALAQAAPRAEKYLGWLMLLAMRLSP
jgi:malonyl-CoA O-methyltransferase